MQERHSRIPPKKAPPGKKRRKTFVPRPLAGSLGRFASALACCAALAAGTARSDAATFYWDTDGVAGGNTTDGAGLGGTGTWDTASAKWWNGAAADVPWANSGNDAIFAGTAGIVALGLPITANSLTFIADGFTLSGSTLTLSSGIINVAFADTAVISSLLTGSGGLTINGGGGVRLTNAGNNYTGTTTINNGSLIIADGAALNNTTETSTILVNGSIVRGAGGGSLVLDGNSVNGVTLSRNIDIMGLGPISDKGVPLISVRNNILSGIVSRSLVNTNNTQVYSAGGLLQFTGTLNLTGAAGSQFITFGVTNSVATGNFEVSGTLTGSGSLQKANAGTLILRPATSSGFSGTLRVSGGGTVRLVSDNALGTNIATGTSSVLDLNGGTLEVRMDAPAINAGGSPAPIYQRGSSTIFVDHSPSGNVIGGTASFGVLTFEVNLTLAFNGRNGYGVTFPSATVNGGTGNSTIANNLNGLLTFNGSFWNNADITGARTMTISGNGDTLIGGNVTATGGTNHHSLTKTGSGALTINGTASTLDGSVNIQGGTVAVQDFRAINNNTQTISIGSLAIAGALSITGVTPAAGDLTTSKVINLAGTNGNAIIYANQTGVNPVIFNANLAATGAGAKTLILGGTNSADNSINGVILDNAAANRTGVSKIGLGTWVLGGTNTYTGATTITGGTLKLKASAGTSDIIQSSATNTVVFGTDTFSQTAGGILEFVGAAAATSETLGVLTPTTGAGTVKLTPGAGGATLTFASLGIRGTGSEINFIPTGTGAIRFASAVAGTNNIVGGFATLNGTDFVANVTAGGSVIAATYTAAPATVGLVTANYSTPGIATTGAYAANSIKIVGGTFSGTGQLKITSASATSLGGILFVDSGVGGISGFTSITTSGANQELIFYTGGPTSTNAFTVASPLANGSGAVTKGGDGTMILSGNNSFIGNLNINEGTLRVSGATANLLGTITAVGNITTIRQAATLDINGAGVAAAPYLGAPILPTVIIGGLNGGGSTSGSLTTGAKITNNGTVDSAISIGSATSTASGYYTGIIQDGVNVTLKRLTLIKNGTGVESLAGMNTYTGATVITGGTLAVTNLSNIGLPSGIGAGQAASNAASLVFNGGTLLYTGATGTIFQSTGSPSLSIDRLLTLAGNGTIDSQGSFGNSVLARGNNSAALIFNSSLDVAFSGVGTRTLTLQGDSTGDNRINLLLKNNPNASEALSLVKSGSGVWVLGNGLNSYAGATTINAGVLRAQSGSTLPNSSNLVLNGGVFESSGSFIRSIGPGAVQFQFQAPAVNTGRFVGGLAASDTKLFVTFGGLNPVWGTTSGFVATQDGLVLSSATALSLVDITGNFSLGTGSGAASTPTVNTSSNSATLTLTSGTTAGVVVGQPISGTSIPAGAYVTAINSATSLTISATVGTGATGVSATLQASPLRAIRVDDNGVTATDTAAISGTISGNSGTGIRKTGSGILQLLGLNTYSGETSVFQGTLVVNTLGNTSILPVTGTSVGTSGGADLATNAITLGDGAATAANLEYVGTGETSNRRIRLNTTTGNDQIYADGSGALVLTNVLNDMANGNKTLSLRGSNAQANQIITTGANPLVDRGGTFGITVDGSATWVLSGPNTYTGATTVNVGVLGAGSNSTSLAVGPFGGGTLILTGGMMFAYGADRTVFNPITGNGNFTFIGDYSLSLTGTYTSAGGMTTTNNIGQNSFFSGKILSLGNVTFTAPGGAGVFGINGTGNTAVTGAIQNTTGTLSLTYNPATSANTLTLSGTNIYTGATSLLKGTTILASSGGSHLPATTNLTLGSSGNFAILQLGDAAGPSNVTIRSVALAAGALSNTAIVGGNALPTPSQLTLSPTADFTMPVPIGGSVTDPVQNNLKLIKTGMGTMTMNLTNYYTGGTDIGVFNKPDGGTLAIDGLGTLGNIFLPPRTLNIYGGTLETRAFTVASPEVDNLNLGGGAAGSTAQVKIEKDLLVRGSIKYDATNNPNPAVISGSSGLNLGPTSPTGTTITVGSSTSGSAGALAPDLTISAAILGTSNIHKAGPGTLRLVENGGTTWQQGLFVDAGTLILDGTSSPSGVLANNASITVGLGSAGAKLDFGASRGEQTIFQTLVVNSNSTLTFNLGVSGIATSDNLLLINNNGLTLGTALKININALPGFGQAHYVLIDENANTDPGNAFTLGTRPGGFSYTLDHTFTGGNYLLFLDVGPPLPAFFWKGTVDNKWSALTNGNWVDALNGAVIAGVPGTTNDVTFSANAPLNSANTVVNVNLGVKILTINDPALNFAITGLSGTVLSIGEQLLINSSAGTVSLGSATAGQELFIGVVNNSQSWTNLTTKTLTIFNQVFSQGTVGTQSITFNGSGNVDIKGNIINGGLGGSLQLVQSSPTGTLTLENSGNTYTGGTLISAGTVEFKTGALPALGVGPAGTLPPGRVEFTGDGTLRWLSGNTNDVSDRLMIHDTKVATLDVGTDPLATVTFASPILTSNLDGTPTTGILRKIGSTTLKLANTTGGGYTGGTEIGAGVLAFGVGALPASTGIIKFIGASTLRWSAGNTDDVSNQLRMDGVTATLDTNGNDVTFLSAAILNGTTSTGTLTKAGAGTLTFTQTVPAGTGYSGGTDIAAGTLQFASGALPATGSIRFTGSSTLKWATGNTDNISARLNIPTGVTGTLDTNGNDVIFSQSIGSANSGGQISSPGTLTKDGAGTLSLTVANPNFTGPTNIAGGTLEFANGALPGSGAVTFTGSTTLRWISGNTNDISSRLNIQAGVTATLDTNGSDVTFISPIQGAGATSGSLTKTGSGILALNSASPNFQGALTVDAGTVAVSGSLSGATAVNVSAGATLRLNGTGTNLFSSTVPVAVSMGAGSAANPATMAANINNSIQTLGEFTLAGNSVIDFAGSVATAQLKLGNSAAAVWAGSLSIFNWDGNLSGGGRDQLYFGSDSSGLTAGQLSSITFFSDAGVNSLGTATYASAGEVVPVPEPAGLVALFSGTGCLLALRRRRPAW